jgi:hypothetical protein
MDENLLDRKIRDLLTELREVRRKRENCDGARLHSELTALRGSYYVFEKNYEELVEGLNRLANPNFLLELFESGEQDKFDAISFELSRLLHNFLAGASTLVDHTRRFVDEAYSDTDFMDQYEARKESELAQSPVVQFIRGLRNYTVHRALPLTTTKVNFQRVESGKVKVASSLTLDVNRLREKRKDWQTKGRQYLDALPDEVEVIAVVSEYREVIRRFYLWFLERHQELHREEFEELRALERRDEQIQADIQRAWPEGFA